MITAEQEILSHLSKLVGISEAKRMLEDYKQEILNTEDAKVISFVKYNDLVERSETLRALERGGVDNWSFYEEALRSYFGDDYDDDDDEEVERRLQYNH